MAKSKYLVTWGIGEMDIVSKENLSHCVALNSQLEMYALGTQLKKHCQVTVNLWKGELIGEVKSDGK